MKKPILTTLLFSWCCCLVYGQGKLPGVQEGSFKAPAGIHIDGNLHDWHDTLKAYNKSTSLFYLLANDDKYLYLAARSTDATNIAKIAAGGITLTINTAGKKKDKDAFEITYPVIQRQRGGGRRGRGAGFANDSASRQQLITSSKEIKVIGFKDVDDTLISIYNEYSIKAAINFDAGGAYCYELAVPLKLIGLTTDNIKAIAYHIKLNGLQTNNMMISISGLDGGGVGGTSLSISGDGGGFKGGGGGSSGGRGGGSGGRNGGNSNRNNNINYADLTNPTDFWGTYTLTK
jgi:hypothetical protein